MNTDTQIEDARQVHDYRSGRKDKMKDIQNEKDANVGGQLNELFRYCDDLYCRTYIKYMVPVHEVRHW